MQRTRRDNQRAHAAPAPPRWRWMRWLRPAILWWLALFGVWMLLVDSFARPEVIAGLGAATLTLPVALVISARVERRYHLRLRWLRELRQTPFDVLRDTLIVGRALYRQLIGREAMRGELRLVPFSVPGAGANSARDPAEANAWLALAVIGTSLTPNTYVIGIDAERGVALVHQLVPTEPRSLRRSVIGAAPPDTLARPDEPLHREAGG